jgi:hypothetical protein
VEWLLGELLVQLADARFHVWIQRFAEGPLDGPGLVARIAEAGRGIDSEVAELLLWTAGRGAAVRDGDRGEALFSVVPLVWTPAWPEVSVFARAVVERWPSNLDPSALGAPTSSRAVTEPDEQGRVRYPGCAVGFTPAGASCATRARGDPIATAAHALWRAGASDDELDAFFWETGDAGRQLPEVLARWVLFDGDGGDRGRFDALRRELDPLAEALGVETTDGELVVRVEDVDAMESRLASLPAVRVRTSPGKHLSAGLRAALRAGPDVILVEAADIASDEDARALLQVARTGHILVVGGASERLKAVIASGELTVLRSSFA